MSEEQGDYVTDALEMMGITEPKQIITEVSGFIPIFEAVLNHYKDHMTALVFGRMWQYCGMADGVCRATVDRIADDLQISGATVMRHIVKLEDGGYIYDNTPDRKNRPHEYTDCGKVVMKGSLSAIAQKNVRLAQKNVAIAESQLIKQDNTTINKPDMLDMLLDQERQTQPVRNACIAFETAFLGGSVSGWPWDSKPVWRKFAQWCAAQDVRQFQEYVDWRKGAGKYQAMSNNKIRQDPQMFMDTGWPTFLAHTSMYAESDMVRLL